MKQKLYKKENMVVISVTGGLGNQMFYYALYRYLRIQGINAYLDTNWYSGNNYNNFPVPYIEGEVEHCKYKLEKYFCGLDIKQSGIDDSIRIARKNLDVQMNCESTSYRYIVKAKENKDIYFTGFHRNWDYCYEIRDTLINDFEFSIPLPNSITAFLAEIEISNSVSIHIRRGDYFRSEVFAIHNGSICNIHYYRNAIDLFTNQYENIKFFIFSDDIIWAKDIFSIFDNCFIVDTHLENDSNYYDLMLMSKCKHNIISNSSFSWWAAFLNQNENKQVVVPTLWNRNLNFEKTDYICPPEWIRVSNNPQISLVDGKRNVIPIVYLIDFPIVDHSFHVSSHDVAHLAVSLQSIVENANIQSTYIFYVLHQYISEENIDKIRRQIQGANNFSVEFIDIAEFILETQLYTINKTDSYTFNEYTPFIKFFIPYILHQYDYLVYINNNIILDSDIYTVSKVNIANKAIACCNDTVLSDLFSADLMFISTRKYLSMFSNKNILKVVNNIKELQIVNKHLSGLSADQYFLNSFFSENITSLNKNITDLKIINLNIDKSWTNLYAVNMRYILKYASRTEFFDEILKPLIDQSRCITNRIHLLEKDKDVFEHNEIIIQNLRSSYSYRIGRLITWPLRMLIKCYRCCKQHGLKYTVKLILKKTGIFIKK
jgi:lipopolysaccharide biosynthesis glycosyltransferase